MAAKYKNPAKYRLEFIKENTLNRVWSIRMTRTRVILGTAAVIAGVAAIIWVILAFTPMRALLPGALRGDLRGKYLETALRIDSLEQAARINSAYLSNIVAVMTDELPGDSARALAAEQLSLSDSLLAATEAERLFVSRYDEEERFNLSVLAPIAAEGMIFGAPVAAAAAIAPTTDGSEGVLISSGRSLPVLSIYRGTVLDVHVLPDNRYSVMIQHPNDFITIYNGLGDVFVTKGKKVAGGQSVGQTSVKGAFVFEIWHNGTALDPREYIGF